MDLPRIEDLDPSFIGDRFLIGLLTPKQNRGLNQGSEESGKTTDEKSPPHADFELQIDLRWNPTADELMVSMTVGAPGVH